MVLVELTASDSFETDLSPPFDFFPPKSFRKKPFFVMEDAPACSLLCSDELLLLPVPFALLLIAFGNLEMFSFIRRNRSGVLDLYFLF